MMFTGLAALSVETLKKYFGRFNSQRFKSLIAPKTLFLTKASTEISSFSERTCLCAEKLATTCQVLELKILSKVSLNKFTG